VIAHPEVDAVIVSTSEHEHTEPLLQAIELGKPILVEKPLALSLDDADRVVAAADRKGVDIRIGYSRRHDRRWMLAKEQIREGRLGQIVGATARVYNSRAQMFEILKRSPEATPILDVLTYYVDMACWFLEGNRPIEVVARGQSKIFKEMLGTDGVILLDMDNKDSVLFTDHGVPLAYVPGHAAKMLFMQSNSSGDWAMGDYWGPLANETRSWLDHLVTGRPCPHTTAREGRLTLEVTLAIEHSARTGEAVKLPFHGTHP
jgi:predicted dehydrogenase